jgi:hypothetical protein
MKDETPNPGDIGLLGAIAEMPGTHLVAYDREELGLGIHAAYLRATI